MFDADAPAPEPVELDGWGPANIFDLEDVFDFADVGPDVEVFDEAEDGDEVKAAGDDGYAPDPAMPPAGGAVLRYDGRDYLPDGVPTRAELVAAQDLRDLLGSRTPEGKSTSTKLREKLAAGAPVFFMPSDIEETNDYSDGAPEYVIRAFGALMDGSKAEVVITGVDVFFDVPVPERPPAAALLSGKAAARLEALDPLAARLAGFDSQLREVLAAAGAAGCRIADVTAFPARGYHAAPKPYKRVRTATLQQRKKAIAAVHAADLETASDDRSCYYRKAAREGGLPLSDWAILSQYDYSPGPTERSPLCGHVFRVAAAGYRPLVDQLAPKAEREKTGAVRAANPLLARDRTLVWTWDIETHRGDDTGELPDGERDDDVVFMICGTAHWKDDPTPLAEIGIVDVETAPTVGRTTLVCGSQANVLKAFALVWGALAPDINIGFNDSGYDWPFVVEKARKLGLLAWMWNAMSAAPRKRLLDEDVLKWNVRRDQKIKISPEEVYYSTYLKVPGCVPIDIRACYKKLFPKSETPKAGSLKFYLEISGLSGKVDMPIKRLWRYYEAARETEGEPDAEAAEHMREGLHYCNEDGRRCQQLQVRRNVINDYREVASLAFVSMYDSHYYAGGMKVCNLLGAHAWRRGMLASFLAREREEAGKYPGAYVFPPEKGLTPDPARLAALDTAAAELRSARDAALALLVSAVGDATGQDIRWPAGRASCGGPSNVSCSRELARDEPVSGPRTNGVGPREGLCPSLDRTNTASAAAAAEAICKQAPGSPAALRLEAARAAVVAALQAFAPDRPVTGLDFSSLYPSIIMTYNLSPEKILLTQADADHWAAQGKTLHKIEFPFNGRVVVGWSIMHNNVPEDIGLFPTVLIDLFNRRAEVKVVLGKHGAVKELIESITGRAKKDGVSAAEALRRVRAEAEAEAARTAAALTPGAPPPRISPGATLGEELAELKRLSKNAAEQVAGIRRICEGAEKRAGVPADSTDRTTSDDAIMAELAAVYEKTCFDYVCANSKQNALKVYMNSFYGESGNSLSPFFLLPLAGGVTSAGQANIKAVADFVEGRDTPKKNGCTTIEESKSAISTALVVLEEKKAERPVFRIKYGDTDSLYLQAPNKCFEECDADYVEGRVSREEWWSAMVRITMRALNQIRDEVNAFLRADNGSPYLKMAYEEVLYPVGFTGKKKYFGIPHLNEVNFHPKKLFIRGIDVVKQGQPKMAVDIGYRIMWAGMAINNTRDMRGIVEDVLRDAVVNGAQWSFKDFVKTDAWKPHKNNIPVHRCIARMQARHDAEVAENDRRAAAGAAPRPLLYEMPESGERFSYVIVKTGAAFDLRGCKQEPKKGDRMVFAAAARALGLEVDVAFYMISYVVGLCARFINGDAAFQPPAATLRLLTEKKVDEVSQKNAKKVLTAFLKSLGGVSATVSRNRGYAYRRAFKNAATSCRSSLAGAVGELAAEVLHGDWLSYEFFLGDGGGGDGSDDEGAGGGDRATEAVGAIWAAAGSFVDGIAAARGAAWCTERAQLAGIAANGANQVAAAPAPATAPAPGVAAAAPGAKPSKAAAKPKAAIVPATNLFRAGAPRRRPTISAAAVAAANALTRIETAARDKLAALLPAITRIAGRYEIGLSQLVHHSRAAEHRLHPELGEGQNGAAAETLPAAVTLNDADRVALLDFRDAWFECIGVQLTRRWDTLYADHLRRLKDKRTGAVVAPPKADRARAIAAAAQKLAPIGGVVVHM
jgi:DNA polymerase elongation subunit (family B)